MFIRKPFKAPPGASVTFEVRYAKGRKPFDALADAKTFADSERAGGSWAAINQVITIEVEKRR